MSRIWNSIGLAVLMAALLVGTGAAQTTISGDITTGYEISTEPSSTDALALDPANSPVTYTGSLDVNANTNWVVRASADSVADHHTLGYMSQYDSGVYATPEVKLGAAMNIKSTDTTPDCTTLAPLTAAQVIAGGNGVESHTVTFSQVVGWGDTVLASGKYQIIVTYAITAS